MQGGQYQSLSADQISAVYEASLKILEKTGIPCENGRKKRFKCSSKAMVPL